jgi:hypothetical protein
MCSVVVTRVMSKDNTEVEIEFAVPITSKSHLRIVRIPEECVLLIHEAIEHGWDDVIRDRFSISMGERPQSPGCGE